jgi:hypothetical protein
VIVAMTAASNAETAHVANAPVTCVLLCQVDIPLGGAISWNDVTKISCPIASLLSDELGGLYGPSFGCRGSYPAYFGPPFVSSVQQGVDNNDNPIFGSCTYLTSSLQFACTPCPAGTYALYGGYSNGAPGSATNPTCSSCPFGGSCINGSVSAQPGYWGAPSTSGVVAFALCPSGYCCSSRVNCVTYNSCAGARTGVLCGDCAPGYVEAIGSSLCVHKSACARGKALFWSIFVVAMFLDAMIQLAFVSDVWNPSAVKPDATIKCLLYFLQVQ